MRQQMEARWIHASRRLPVDFGDRKRISQRVIFYNFRVNMFFDGSISDSRFAGSEWGIQAGSKAEAMSKSPSNFRQVDVKRGLKALKTAGAAVKRVIIEGSKIEYILDGDATDETGGENGPEVVL
jgi:hypothetical protein